MLNNDTCNNSTSHFTLYYHLWSVKPPIGSTLTDLCIINVINIIKYYGNWSFNYT